jgi:U3 small nucleolar RNA-associated protein 10
MLRNSDVARFVVSLLPKSIKGGWSHPALLAFNAASLHDFIILSKSLDAGTFAYLLPAVLEPLQNTEAVTKEAIVRSSLSWWTFY